MPILKVIKSPTRVEVGHHQIHKVECAGDSDTARVFVKSHATAEDAAAGEPIAWMWELSAPASLFTSLAASHVEQLLVADSGSPFSGGTIVSGLSQLDLVRAAKWEEIKSERLKAEGAGVEYAGVMYDSDMVSQQRVQGTIQLGQISEMANGPGTFFTDWTTWDNGSVSLGLSQLVGLGISIGQHVIAVHEHGRRLRGLIFDPAATVEEIRAIHWNTIPFGQAPEETPPAAEEGQGA